MRMQRLPRLMAMRVRRGRLLCRRVRVISDGRGPMRLWGQSCATAISAACGLLFWAATPANAFHMRHHALPGCPQTRSRLVVADAQAAIYESKNRSGEREYFGCAYGARRGPFGLGRVPRASGGGVEEIATLAGVVVAYEEFFNTKYNTSWFITVRDLHNGRILRQISVPGFTTDIVIRDDGAVAWIVQTRVQPAEYEVHIDDRAGSQVIALGQTIEPSSLALAGDTLYWAQSGRPYELTLN
jgi:hypothetical protein